MGLDALRRVLGVRRRGRADQDARGRRTRPELVAKLEGRPSCIFSGGNPAYLAADARRHAVLGTRSCAAMAAGSPTRAAARGSPAWARSRPTATPGRFGRAALWQPGLGAVPQHVLRPALGRGRRVRARPPRRSSCRRCPATAAARDRREHGGGRRRHVMGGDRRRTGRPVGGRRVVGASGRNHVRGPALQRRGS